MNLDHITESMFYSSYNLKIFWTHSILLNANSMAMDNFVMD